jgi:serine/threonine protein phosphatase PrpC
VASSPIRLAGVWFSVDIACQPAPGKGHDAVLVGPEFAAVADGATPLRGPGSGDASSLAGDDQAVRNFSAAALDQLRAHRRLDVQAMFAAAITALGSTAGAAPPGTCTVALVRGRGAELTVAVLGDCAAVLARTDGQVQVVHDDRVATLDDQVVAGLRQRLAAGMSYQQAIGQLTPLLQANRRRHNTPDGYWVVGSDPGAAAQVYTVSCPAELVEAVLVCTDGLTRLVSPFEWVNSHQDLLAQARRHGLEQLAAQVRTLERAPGSMLRHPRLGQHDDITAVLLTREPDARGPLVMAP